MDQRPLANADGIFTPLETKEGKPGVESSGKTDDQGHYTLGLTQDSRDGYVPGFYCIRVSIFDRGGRGQLVPEQSTGAAR